MAKPEEHIAQAKRNLIFLSSINKSIKDCYDWQVTVCFYSALHLVNAHLSNYGLQYRKHKDVNNALNFSNATSPARLPEDEYICYTALQSLSRRSRYLVNENDGKLGSMTAAITYDKHFARALRHLDKLTLHFCTLLKVQIDPVDIVCIEIKHPVELLRQLWRIRKNYGNDTNNSRADFFNLEWSRQ